MTTRSSATQAQEQKSPDNVFARMERMNAYTNTGSNRQQQLRQETRMTLRSWLMVLTAAVFGLVLFGLIMVFQRALETYSNATATSAVQTRATALGAFMSRTFYEEWKNVEAAALRLDPSSGTQVMRIALTFLAGNQEKATWIGVARSDGVVVAGTNRAREGTNVSDRAWFRRGMEGPFAGDVHESEAMTKILEPEASELLRFVDFSAPVYTPEGSVYGVLGVLVNWRWVRAFIGDAAHQLELDAYLVNRSGTIVMGTAEYTEATADLAVFRAAALHSTGTFQETWPDGKQYFTATFPELRHETLPPFGWSIVVRLDPIFVTAAERNFRNVMRLSVVVSFFLAVLLVVVLAGVFTRPLNHLIEAILDVAKGVPPRYVPEYRRSLETSRLSEALVRLQSGQPAEQPGAAGKQEVSELSPQ